MQRRGRSRPFFAATRALGRSAGGTMRRPTVTMVIVRRPCSPSSYRARDGRGLRTPRWARGRGGETGGGPTAPWAVFPFLGPQSLVRLRADLRETMTDVDSFTAAGM